MKKNLLALAVASALIAPAALADVTLYGTISESIESVKATGSTNSANDIKSTTRISSNVSKLGFKGNEDLGDGLKAIWQVEQEISVDDGGTRKGTFATRNSFVGLDGAFGKAFMGYNDSAYKALLKPILVNPMADTIAEICTDKSVFCHGDARLANSVHYYTPNFAGFQAGVSYGTDETRKALSADGSDRTNMDVWSLAAAYSIDGFNVGVGYDRRNDKNAVAGDTNLNQSFWKVAASYKFGDTKIGAGFEQERNDKSTGDTKQNAWTVGAEQKFGNFGVSLAYAKLQESKSDAKDGAKQWTLGATYDLSKRTQTYAYYTRIANDDNGTRTFGNAGLTNYDNTGKAIGVGAGSNPTGFGVGLKHSF
ncbi:porin [Pseudogulbenkiania subflava]|uniref:Outer membrane protein (Porin) n=1 Tax=Pseudogulbenkiania subflava DSM 22618 TaxID=1123014 RepID=A0A1Y6BR78_9NEIS|nr:porin [Pseudogulbenkiania subflava]SMF15781.1 Outer membrane protein (porin) [Pseudogulbenkiania subflava DSM 22618]